MGYGVKYTKILKDLDTQIENQRQIRARQKFKKPKASTYKLKRMLALDSDILKVRNLPKFDEYGNFFVNQYDNIADISFENFQKLYNTFLNKIESAPMLTEYPTSTELVQPLTPAPRIPLAEDIMGSTTDPDDYGPRIMELPQPSLEKIIEDDKASKKRAMALRENRINTALELIVAELQDPAVLSTAITSYTPSKLMLDIAYDYVDLEPYILNRLEKRELNRYSPYYRKTVNRIKREIKIAQNQRYLKKKTQGSGITFNKDSDVSLIHRCKALQGFVGFEKNQLLNEELNTIKREMKRRGLNINSRKNKK